MVNVCSVCGIEQFKLNSHLTFHTIPKNPDFQKEWLKVLKIKNPKNIIVCSKHFNPDDYRKLCDRPLLKIDAIPRLPTELDGDGQLSWRKKSKSTNGQSVRKSSTVGPAVPDDHRKLCDKSVTTTTTAIPHLLAIELNGDDEIHLNERRNINEQNATESLIESEVPEYYNSRKRVSDAENELLDPARKRYYLRNLDMFRREDFAEEKTWNRFVKLQDEIRKENHLLQRKNGQLLKQMMIYRDLVKKLKEGDLSTDSVEEKLNSSHEESEPDFEDFVWDVEHDYAAQSMPSTDYQSDVAEYIKRIYGEKGWKKNELSNLY